MNTDNIYRSIVKETEEEVLVYRTMFDNYKDLRSQRKFSNEELSKLVSLSKMLGTVTNVSRKNAVQLYYDCKNAELFFHSVYIGDLAIIKESDLCSVDSQYGLDIIARNKVFSKVYDEYIDMDDYESYRDDDIKVGKTIVVNATLINEHFNHELPGTKQSKQKILSFCQKKFSGV